MLSGTVLISRPTAVALGAAAAETGASLNRMASIAIEAAVRLYLAERGQTAMPVPRSERDEPLVTVLVTLQHPIFVVLADQAVERKVSIDEQIRAILDAAVAGYDPVPPEAERRIERDLVKVKAIPQRAPFDPAYYAKHAYIPEGAGTAPALRKQALTHAVFGDPGTGPSYFTERGGAGRQVEMNDA